MAADERPGPNDELRDRLGLVLLDLGDGDERPVELEAGHGRRYPAAENVESGFQLHAGRSGFPGLTGELLRGSLGETEGRTYSEAFEDVMIQRCRISTPGVSSASDWVQLDSEGYRGSIPMV